MHLALKKKVVSKAFLSLGHMHFHTLLEAHSLRLFENT